MPGAVYENVTKVFEGGADTVVAVDDLSFEINDGEFLVLVGPSGCGKSTTLRLLAGLETISDGEVRIDGEVVNDQKPKDRDIAMVFQSYALYPQKTVRENMEFGLRMTTELPDSEIVDRIERTAEMLGIDDLLDRKPNALSGGQKQRVALGRAIVREPSVFLMDEPLSNLDAKLRTEMRTELQQLQDDLDVATLYVTHDQTEAMTMGDRIAVLDDGKLQQIGTPLECYHEPSNLFVAGFIGDPSMNFLELEYDRMDGTARGTGVSYRFVDEQRARLENGLTGDGVTLGIRPEDIEVAESADPTTVEAEVEVVEPMGKENFLHVSVGDARLTASISGEYVVDEDRTLRLRFPQSKVHAFDSASGDAVFNRDRAADQLPPAATL
ncbi:ABC transporter ATP-binding protein [Natronococcus sp. A-GB7]|uniref:ABC transporter ATP-binding protein n=1 Tax=Natronococcus sp. A-GB7 TaxID=3037649 RepID=UPI00241C5753|nr:ABC transporter ATP-binding protein [Natronococcus sp. A-GB7]MDG5819018.1 ABC transporter ATP-binding protein [Natronococcus sp. A-GB7]